LAFATFLVGRLQTGACGVGAYGFWRYRMPSKINLESLAFHILQSTAQSDDIKWQATVIRTSGGIRKRQKPQAPKPQAPVRNRQTRKVVNAKVRIG